jgi:hypothetical protein
MSGRQLTARGCAPAVCWRNCRVTISHTITVAKVSQPIQRVSRLCGDATCGGLAHPDIQRQFRRLRRRARQCSTVISTSERSLDSTTLKAFSQIERRTEKRRPHSVAVKAQILGFNDA